MAFFKRAAAPGVALVLCFGLLAGVHWLSRAIHGPDESTARSRAKYFGSKSATTTVDATTENNPINKTVADRGTPVSASTGPWIQLGPPASIDCLVAQAPALVFSKGSQPPACHPTTVNGTASVDASQSPKPLPPSTNAVPLPPAGSDFPAMGEPSPPHSLPASPRPSRPSDSAGRGIVDKELPNSSPEERNLWHETLKDLPANDLRELLRLRSQLGRLQSSFVPTPSLHENPPLPEPPPLLPPGARTSERNLPPSWPGESLSVPGPAFAPAGDVDPERMIRESLTAIEQARQVIVHNIANAQTIAYKRRLISFESGADSAKAGRPTTGPSPFQRPDATADLGVRVGTPMFDMTPGKLRRTDRSLDLAIDGEGFFQLQSTRPGQSNPTWYTRCGRFTTDATGRIVLRTSRGDWLLQPVLVISPGTTGIEISSDGVVRGWEPRNRGVTAFGTICTACPPSENLELLEGSIFAVPKDQKSIWQGTPGMDNKGGLRSGFLEESNVNLKQEMAELERLDEQAHVLRQASRMFQFSTPEPPSAPVNGPPLVPGPLFPTARSERW